MSNLTRTSHGRSFTIGQAVMNEFIRLFAKSELYGKEYYNKIATMNRDKKNIVVNQEVAEEQHHKFNVVGTVNGIKKAILPFLLVFKK
jgi:hypothetical protein